METCDKCGNTGWIKVGDNAFNLCDCPAGQSRRGPTYIAVYPRPETGTQPHLIKPKQPDPVDTWFNEVKRQMGAT